MAMDHIQSKPTRQLTLSDVSAYEVVKENYVTDAMAIAAKNGHGLRKVGLRTLMGKILIASGNLESGKALLTSALRAATTIGYQKAIETIESEHVKISQADNF